MTMNQEGLLREVLTLSGETYGYLRDYAIEGKLAVVDKEERILLAQIREILSQAKGLTDAIERR